MIAKGESQGSSFRNEVRAKHALRVIGEQLELPIIVYVDPRTAKPDQMLGRP